MSIHDKLLQVQSKLKAPKSQFNKFGNYHYRSCEDILEGLKPLLKEVGATLTITDTIEHIGERYYVKATAAFRDAESILEVTAYAREEETRKGMDGSQITGSASSYARKYALNGLFCIDDTKDADASTPEEPKKPAPKKQTNEEVARRQMFALMKEAQMSAEDMKALIKERFGKERSADLTMKEVGAIIDYLTSLKKEKKSA